MSVQLLKMDENNEAQSIEMIDLKKIDYNQVCRGCLSQDDDLKPMYAQLETNLHGNVVLSDMFMECTSIQVSSLRTFYQYKKYSLVLEVKFQLTFITISVFFII